MPHSKSVGVILVDDTKKEAFFAIKMYYGPIGSDIDTMTTVPGVNEDNNYLRFRINYLAGYDSQATVGKMIQKALHAYSQVELSGEDHKGRRVHVCGDEAASYFVVAFLPQNTDINYKVDFRVLAKAIAGGVDEGGKFEIDDGKAYTYNVSNVTASSAVMMVKRLSQ